MMEERETKLLVEDLAISFWTNQGMVRAVRGVSFELKEQETLAIVGESGSGKSVTNRAIMGILAGNGVINRGKIMYDGQDLTKIEEEDFHRIRGDRIGMIFQDPMSSLNPIMRIGKQITEGMLINGKRLKRRYKQEVNKVKQELKNAKREKDRLIKEYKDTFKGPKREIRELKSEYRTKKKSLKRKHKKTRGRELKEQLRQDIAEQKALIPSKEERLDLKAQLKKDLEPVQKKIKPAREKFRQRKKEVREGIKKDWREKKESTREQIRKVREETEKKIQNNPEEKRKLRKERRKKVTNLHEEQRRFKKVTRKEAKERALKIMSEVGIPEPERRFRQYPFQFSGGMRQRIVIAIALTADPDVLICDEPTTALDVTIQQQILDLIKKLKVERNLSVIFITHDLGVVANMADRVAVMYAGKIVEIGTSDDIFYNPKHPYTWALLSSMPNLDTMERLTAIHGTPPDMLHPPKGDAFAERNEYAMKIDFEEEPPFFKISDTHYAATWLLHKDAPKVEPPEGLRDRIKQMLDSHDKEGALADGDSTAD